MDNKKNKNKLKIERDFALLIIFMGSLDKSGCGTRHIKIIWENFNEVSFGENCYAGLSETLCYLSGSGFDTNPAKYLIRVKTLLKKN